MMPVSTTLSPETRSSCIRCHRGCPFFIAMEYLLRLFRSAQILVRIGLAWADRRVRIPEQHVHSCGAPSIICEQDENLPGGPDGWVGVCDEEPRGVGNTRVARHRDDHDPLRETRIRCERLALLDQPGV